MLHVGLLVWYHCSMRIQVLAVFKFSQHRTWRVATTTAGSTSVSMKISSNKQQFSVDVSHKLLPPFNITLRYYSNYKYSCFSASWSFLVLGEDLKWKSCDWSWKTRWKKPVQLFHLFYTPKMLTLGLSQHQRKFCSLSYPVKFTENSAEQMEIAFGTLHFLWVNKMFSIWAVLLKGGFFKDLLHGTFWSSQQ